MSAVATAPSSPRAPLGRLTAVELRKAVDTRSGRWLLVVLGVVCVGVAILNGLFEQDPLERGVRGSYAAQYSTALVLLPVVGILLVTSEWSQRTTLTTYALVPARWRVTAAKAGAATLLAVGTNAFTLAIAAAWQLLAPLWSDGGGRWDLSLALTAQVTLVGVVSTLGGLAFGLALMSSPVAIVLYFALPTVLTVVAETVKRLSDPLRWLDINLTLPELYLPGVSSQEWARAATSVVAWVVVPLVIGTVRTSRREVA